MTFKTFLMTTAAAVIGMTSVAHAGGFAVREQSASSQGASYAGNAAGGDLSSMFWNPAALAASKGTNSENHFTVFIADTEMTADGGTLLGFDPAGTRRTSGDIAQEAIIPSSYFGTQLSPNFWAGLAINSPFGLVTKPEDRDWIGGLIARKSKIFTINANPNVAYQVMPGVSIGVGLQVQYMDAQLKFATSPLAVGSPSAVFDGDDIGFGGTAGIYLNPAEGTQIGIGYRSQVTHQLDGDFGIVNGAQVDSSVELTTPDVITFSIRQAVSPSMRLMATIEWTNWSDFGVLTVSNATPIGLPTAAIEANWNDAWFASVGAEFDVSDALTIRGGVAYEESPIDTPEQRLTPVPDSDRFWVSVGGTYRFSEHTTLDFAYSHVFVDDARFNRASAAAPALTLSGSVETDVDLISFSIKSKLDANHPILGPLFQ